MKQLLHPLSSDAAFVVPARRPATSSYARAPRPAQKVFGSDVTGLVSFEGGMSRTEGHLCHLGANGRTAITTDADRRPPETPT